MFNQHSARCRMEKDDPKIPSAEETTAGTARKAEDAAESHNAAIDETPPQKLKHHASAPVGKTLDLTETLNYLKKHLKKDEWDELLYTYEDVMNGLTCAIWRYSQEKNLKAMDKNQKEAELIFSNEHFNSRSYIRERYFKILQYKASHHLDEKESDKLAELLQHAKDASLQKYQTSPITIEFATFLVALMDKCARDRDMANFELLFGQLEKQVTETRMLTHPGMREIYAQALAKSVLEYRKTKEYQKLKACLSKLAEIAAEKENSTNPKIQAYYHQSLANEVVSYTSIHRDYQTMNAKLDNLMAHMKTYPSDLYRNLLQKSDGAAADALPAPMAGSSNVVH